MVEVSPSAYYAYKQRPQSGPAQMAEAVLVDEIPVYLAPVWHPFRGTLDTHSGELQSIRREVVLHNRVSRRSPAECVIGRQMELLRVVLQG